MTTIIVNEDVDRFHKTQFRTLDELWHALQENFPVDLYEVAPENLSEAENAAYQKHLQADKSQYQNFRG